MCVKLLKLTGVLKNPQSDLCAEHVQKQALITPDACICNKTVPKYSSPTRIVRKCDFDLFACTSVPPLSSVSLK